MWSSSTSSGYNYEGAAAAAVDGGGDQYGHHHLHDLNVVDIPNSLPPSTCATDPNFNTEVVRTTSSRLRPLIPKPSPYTVSSSTTPPAINIITSTFHPHASHHHHHLHHSGSSSQDQDQDQDQDYNINNNSIKDKEPQQFLHYYHPTSTCPMMTVSAAAQNQQQQQVTTTMTSSRWNPTPEQLQTLEELYRRGTRTPSTEQIQHITSQLSKYGKIEGKNVFYWFQNHKARERQKRRRRELDHHHHHQYQRRPSLDEGPSNFINLATTRHERSGGAGAVTTEGRVSSSRFEGEEKMETRTWLPSTTHCSASIAPDSRQQHMTHEIAGVMSTQSAAAATDAAAVISTEGRRRTNTNTNNSSMKDYYYFYKQPIDLEAEEGHHHHDDGGENVIRFDDDDDDDDFRHDIRPASTPTCTTTTGGSRGWNDTWQGQKSSTFCGLSSCCGPTVPLPTASANMIGLDQYGMDMNSTFKASSTRNSDDHHQDYCATLELFPLKAQHMKNQEQGLLHGGSDDTDLMRTQQIHFYEFL